MPSRDPHSARGAQLPLPSEPKRYRLDAATILWADDSGRRLAAFEHQHRHCAVVRRITPNGYQCLRCATCRAEIWSRLDADPRAS